MLTLRHAGALMLGALLTAALPACSKHNAESPANPPMGVATKTTPDSGGTNGAGNSTSGATGGTAATQGTQPTSGAKPADTGAGTPGTSTPPSGQPPGH